MKGNIRFAKDTDENAIKNICVNSFTLTSFDIDPTFKNGGGMFYFDFYVKLALMKYPSQCFVYEENKNILAFILYGVDNITKNVIDKKIGNILLVAVSKEHMGKGIGGFLIKYVVEQFDSMGFDLITVGTDCDNIAALNAYQNEGFRTILTWSTLRFYKGNIKSESDIPLTISLEKNKDMLYSVINNTSFIRTHSYFYDRNLPKDKILYRMKKSLIKEFNEGLVLLYKIMLEEELIGVVSVRHDIALSNYSKRLFERIESFSIIDKYKNNKYILSNIFRTLLKEIPFEIMESWASSDKLQYLNASLNAGFSLIHTATVLHRWRKK